MFILGLELGLELGVVVVGLASRGFWDAGMSRQVPASACWCACSVVPGGGDLQWVV